MCEESRTLSGGTVLKFVPHPMIRYFSGFGVVILLDGIPLALCVLTPSFTEPEGQIMLQSFCLLMALCGCVLIHIGFWEKCFSTLILTEEEICWKCPFRKDRVISINNCVEIGAYMENERNGIPSEQIYFSDHPDPEKNIKKNGAMKASKHLIKFFYSRELSNYLLENYSEKLTWRLYEYCDKRQRQY